MEDVKDYLSDSQTVLNQSHLEEVLRIYTEKRIVDVESIKKRERKLFAGEQTVKFYNNKAYYFRQCLVCGSVVPQDCGKFRSHIVSHFNKMPRELVDVWSNSSFGY